MRKSVLNEAWHDKFVSYAIRYGEEHDKSYTSREDMTKFKMGEENPTMILTEEGEIIAVASLIYNEYFIRGNRTRLRIFHVRKDFSEGASAYRQLHQFVVEQLKRDNLDHAFLFIPLSAEEEIGLFKGMGMAVERYVFYMENTLKSVRKPQFPEGVILKDFVRDRDEEIWLKIRNEAFATLTGNSTPVTMEGLMRYLSSSDHTQKGMKILYEGEKPLGIVQVETFEENGKKCSDVGPVAVLKDYRNRGLGGNLIRAGLMYAKENGHEKVGLSVDTQNEHAKNIYLSEGFEPVESLVCLRILNEP